MKQKEQETRLRLVELTGEGLGKIQNYKQKTTVEILGARIGKLLAKYKVGKLINWSIEADSKNKSSSEHQVIWSINQDKISQEELLDGCYVITTDVKKEDMNAAKVVASYKKLTLVENAFRNLKTVQLEMRPIYHKNDKRIRAHVFLCMLAYHVQWHMQNRLRPLFDEDGKGKDRQWTFANMIQTLQQITRNKISVGGVEFHKNSQPTQDQQKILELLQTKL